MKQTTSQMAQKTEEREAKAKARREAKAAAREAQRIQWEKDQRPVKSMTLTVDWYKNRTWGNCPKMTADVRFHDGGRIRQQYGGVTGCGYDKESTIVAKAFNDFLAYKLHIIGERDTTPYGMRLCKDWKYYDGGVGMSCYYPISEFIGGKLSRVATGKTFDVYEYEDIEGAPIGGEVKEPPSPFGAIAMVAKMMSIISDTPEQANDAQKRILKAGLGEAVSFPDNWDTLSEEEKAKRLGGAIEAIS